VLALALVVNAAAAAAGPPPAEEGKIWPGGLVPYYFDADVDSTSRTAIEDAMRDWEEATDDAVQFLTCDDYAALAFPDDVGARVKLLAACRDDADLGSLRVRNNWIQTKPSEPKSESSYGCGKPAAGSIVDEPDKIRLRLPAKDTNVVKFRHELGHCIGLAHEHERSDRDDYLDFVGSPGWSTRSQPLVGNFDYRSIMIYDSYEFAKVTGGVCGGKGALRYEDLHRNLVCKATISPLDASRVLQMYAPPEWDGFRALSRKPAGPTDDPGGRSRRPDLVRDVPPVGSPAIARVDATRSMVIARGSNDTLYAAEVADGASAVAVPWTRLGCCAGSDPAAVYRGTSGGKPVIDVVFVGRDSGRVVQTSYRGGKWSGLSYVPGGPAGGIAERAIGGPTRFAAPAIAAWDATRRDVFVTGADTVLYHAYEVAGRGWSSWRPVSDSAGGRWSPGAAYTANGRLFVAINTGTIRVRKLEDGAWEPVWWNKGGTPAGLAAPAVTGRRGGWYRLFVTDGENRLATYPALPDFEWGLVGGVLDADSSPAVYPVDEDGLRMAIHGTLLVDHLGGEIEDGGLWLRSVAARR
jgi:hypothetical protein